MVQDDDLEKLAEQERALEAQLRAVRAKRAKLERKAGPGAAPRSRAGGVNRALREVVLDLLAEAGTPLNSLLIASVLRPLQDRTVPSTRFGTLSKDEQASFASGRPREVYLCHCLTHDQGQAMKRFWARSDWPLNERVIGPMTGRLLFLRGAAWTIRLARDVASYGVVPAANPALLNFVAADQARDAGALVMRDHFPYNEWLTLIEKQIERHEAEDAEIRESAATFLKQNLKEDELLFGARPPFVTLPGSSSRWRSTGQ